MLWLDVLNRALEWSGPQRPSGEGADAVSSQAALLRRVVAARLLGVDLDLEDRTRLSQWLRAVTLTLTEPRRISGDGGGTTLKWPALRAPRLQGRLPEPYESQLGTALVQFLAQWSDSLATVVCRCHGIRRGSASNRDLPAAWEAEFARRAGIVELLRNGDMHQCGRMVWAERGSHYCGKACSNASFAARKAREQPRYFARKQERYRLRQESKKKPRRDGGAFVYMDAD